VIGALWVVWVCYVASEKGVWGLALPSIIVGLLLGVVMLLGGMYWVAGFVLPTEEGKAERGKIFKSMLDYAANSNYPFYVIKKEAYAEDKIEERSGEPFSYMALGPGIALSPCDHAVVVSNGVNFEAFGSPVVFTGFAQRVVHALDLRPQLRTFLVQGLTQDGIQVVVQPAFTPFQVGLGSSLPEKPDSERLLPCLFPYDSGSTVRAVLAQPRERYKTDAGGEGTHWEEKGVQWDELSAIYGVRILQDILSRYRFDELYGPLSDIRGEIPRVRIARDFCDEVRAELRAVGITLVGGGIGNIKPVQTEVLEQRIRSWQAGWTHRVVLRQARSRAEWLQRVERVRARAQADLIMAFGERLANLQRLSTHVSPEGVAEQFLEVLEELARQPPLQPYLSHETEQDMRRLKENLDS